VTIYLHYVMCFVHLGIPVIFMFERNLFPIHIFLYGMQKLRSSDRTQIEPYNSKVTICLCLCCGYTLKSADKYWIE